MHWCAVKFSLFYCDIGHKSMWLKCVSLCVVGREFDSTSPAFVRRKASPKSESSPHFWGREILTHVVQISAAVPPRAVSFWTSSSLSLLRHRHSYQGSDKHLLMALKVCLIVCLEQTSGALSKSTCVLWRAWPEHVVKLHTDLGMS